jgi:prevent-host-death family protein
MSTNSFHKGTNLWQTQKAKAEFSKLLRDSQEKGDQIITCRDEPVAVLISKKRYDKLMRQEGSLLEFFQKAPLPNVDIPTKRSRDLPREVRI